MSSIQPLQLQVDQPAPRLDQWLAQALPQLSRSQLQKLIRQGQVLVAGQTVRPSSAVQPGEVITVYLPTPEPDAPQPETTPLAVIYEDDDLVVINKPAGMVVHPAHGHESGTLVNALLARYPDLAALAESETDSSDRPGIVHRLDRDTSGLIVVARTPPALRRLQQQFKARTIEKTYLALVFGRPEAPEGIIEVPLGRDPRFRQKMAPRADGKPARTHYRVLEDFEQYSLLEIGLETGRTHQIRVHLAWLKCPVVGDTVYGRKKNVLGLKRQFLHAWRLRFHHPRTGETIELEAPLDAHLQAVLGYLRRQVVC
ncbi:MAG: RluA family pseudouridine synthase [Anaerolineae bacterium]|nr:RluA family pseudouridine synthase [Anaerolineae bacterium]